MSFVFEPVPVFIHSIAFQMDPNVAVHGRHPDPQVRHRIHVRGERTANPRGLALLNLVATAGAEKRNRVQVPSCKRKHGISGELCGGAMCACRDTEEW